MPSVRDLFRVPNAARDLLKQMTAGLSVEDAGRFREPIVARPVGRQQGVDAGRIGTAFDYLLRFYAGHLNPFCVEDRWIADGALPRLARAAETGRAPAHLWACFDTMLVEARRHQREFDEEGTPPAAVIDAVLGLAWCDLIVRPGIDRAFPHRFPLEHEVVAHFAATPSERTQLVALLALARRSSSWLVAQDRCLLNPTRATDVFDGDADLTADDMIVDIKAVSDFSEWRSALQQTLCSFVAGRDADPVGHGVNRVGVYMARHGQLVSVAIDQLSRRDLAALQRLLTSAAFADELVDAQVDRSASRRGASALPGRRRAS